MDSVSSSNLVIFRRFLPADWSKGLFVVSTYSDSVFPAENPLWLTSHLLRESTDRTGFLRWFFGVTNAFFAFHDQTVDITRFGCWKAKVESEGWSTWSTRKFTCTRIDGGERITVPLLYREYLGKLTGRSIKFRKPDGFKPPGLWLIGEQFYPWLPGGAEEYALKEEVAAIRYALENWLLPAGPFLVPAEKKVPRRQWEKARREGLPTAISEVWSKDKGSRTEYLITGEFAHLTPSQRAAVFSLPPEDWEESGWSEEKDREAWKKRITWGPEYWENFQVTPGRLQHITAYRRKQWEFTIATAEKFMSSEFTRDNLFEKIPFWPAKDYPIGWLFSSSSLLALVWAEIFWCTANNVTANYCAACGNLLAVKKNAEFCSKKCWEAAQVVKEGIRQDMKAMHQQLSRLAKRVEKGEISVEHYITAWQEWEKLKQQAAGRGKPAIKIHPAIVALRSPEGKRLVRAAREAGKDTYAREYAWREILAWLGRKRIAVPPEEWLHQEIYPRRQKQG
ncbi:hypothetical protein Desku_3513 [Desulfofundulus kuznetsovii DSM 6115]|uniref:Uncharacterized protein n=1 Tax=Desulfofundulus kuznetsovii (strain DSM 6115 / VKM B-1805 / 17) TaxID=760568 RepID=A0AAU8PZY3_DESK7|nr:hypothetical protein Desku_3513 [Desulfofundulus kuznetsovii DSM 6115]